MIQCTIMAIQNMKVACTLNLLEHNEGTLSLPLVGWFSCDYLNLPHIVLGSQEKLVSMFKTE